MIGWRPVQRMSLTLASLITVVVAVAIVTVGCTNVATPRMAVVLAAAAVANILALWVALVDDCQQWDVRRFVAAMREGSPRGLSHEDGWTIMPTDEAEALRAAAHRAAGGRR
jgi:mannitol-specific phosphotransferase system IIBC component